MVPRSAGAGAGRSLMPRLSTSMFTAASPIQFHYRKIFDDNFRSAPIDRKRYKNTSVLLVSWADNDLDIHPEITRLKDVLQDDYNFKTQVLRVSDSRPQSQLNEKLAMFVREHGLAGHLLIIYYAGHGHYNRSERVFELYKRTSGASIFAKSNCIRWNSIEHNLDSSDADVLCIFDCCEAGMLADGRGPARFEYLGACGAGQVTAPGGDGSFTSALIQVLEDENVDGQCYISLPALKDKIVATGRLPQDQRPFLGHRWGVGAAEHIIIAPQNSDNIPIRETTAKPGLGDVLEVAFEFEGKVDDYALGNFASLLASIGSHSTLDVKLKHAQLLDKLRASAPSGRQYTTAELKAEVIARIMRRKFSLLWISRTPSSTERWSRIQTNSRPLNDWIEDFKMKELAKERTKIAEMDHVLSPDSATPLTSAALAHLGHNDAFPRPHTAIDNRTPSISAPPSYTTAIKLEKSAGGWLILPSRNVLINLSTRTALILVLPWVLYFLAFFMHYMLRVPFGLIPDGRCAVAFSRIYAFRRENTGRHGSLQSVEAGGQREL